MESSVCIVYDGEIQKVLFFHLITLTNNFNF